MDIEIAKKAKSQCESEIKAILRTFELQTGLSVKSLDLLNHQAFGKKQTETIHVYIKAEL